MTGPSDRTLPTYGHAGSDEVAIVPWPLLLRHRIQRRARGERYRWWVLWAVLFGLFSVNVTFTILAVALPRIATELHTTTDTLTWVITGPLLAFGVAAPILGKTGDVYGHRRLYLIGLTGAGVAAGMAALAPSAGALIGIRVFGSIEGAATGAASMALIFSVFEPEDRVKAMGFWSLVAAGGPVIGVAIGGPVVEAVGWRWVFAAQVPLVAVAVVVGAAILPETTRSARQVLDVLGAATLIVGIVSLLVALNRGPIWGWTSPAVLVAFVLCPVGLVAFVAAERRAAHPLLPLGYFSRRNFIFPIGAMSLANFAYMGGFILAPVLLASSLFGYGETRIGLIVLARPLVFSVVAPIAGYLTVRAGERAAGVAGGLVLVGSMLAFAGVGARTSDLYVIGALALSGAGLGISSPAMASSVANSVEPADLGIASAAQQLLSQVGLVAGIQVMQTVQAARQRSVGLAGGFRAAYLVGAAAAGLALLSAAFVRSESRLGDGAGEEPAPDGRAALPGDGRAASS